MKHKLMATAASFAVFATGAVAGGIERSTQSVGILFEEGRYAELSFASVNPSVSGNFGASSSGNMASSYMKFGFSYKQDLGDNLSFALIYDQPVGADVSYPIAAAYPFRRATATIDSNAITGILRYKLPSNVSFYGGIRAQQVNAKLNLPTGGGPYSLTTTKELDFGYVLGVAYEKPEIALRVALTYNSEISHKFVDNAAAPFDVIIPQSWNLEFQSGVSKNTLVFGSIRWVEWTKFNVSPPDYGAGNPLASGKKNTTSYTLGVGRKFNDTWSAAVILGYEGAGGVPVGNLGPTDGYKSISLATTYKHNNMKITGGVSYIDIGNATTTTIGANFTNNHAIAVGFKIGYSF